VRRSDAPRLVAIALAGGAIGPVLLAWGLQRAGATVGALLLNLEVVFTIALARWVCREPIGRRLIAASACMLAGGATLAIDAAAEGNIGLLGALAVAGATFAWALDNTWTRPLATRDPWQVILIKGAAGAALTASLAAPKNRTAIHCSSVPKRSKKKYDSIAVVKKPPPRPSSANSAEILVTIARLREENCSRVAAPRSTSVPSAK
jgi:hypothetical protein